MTLASEEKAVGKTKTTFSFILLSFPLTAKLAQCHCSRRYRRRHTRRHRRNAMLRRAIARCRTATASPAYSPPPFSPLPPVHTASFVQENFDILPETIMKYQI